MVHIWPFFYANEQMLQFDWSRDPFHCSLLQSDWLRAIRTTLTTEIDKIYCCERGHVFRWIKTSETATGTQVFFVHDEYFYITTWTRVTAQYSAIHILNLVLSLQLLPVYNS